MNFIYRSFMIIILLALTIIGLNTSNQGINQLTTLTHGPVVGLSFNDKQVTLQAMGENYQYSRDRLYTVGIEVQNQYQNIYAHTQKYMNQIGVIARFIINPLSLVPLDQLNSCA